MNKVKIIKKINEIMDNPTRGGLTKIIYLYNEMKKAQNCNDDIFYTNDDETWNGIFETPYKAAVAMHFGSVDMISDDLITFDCCDHPQGWTTPDAVKDIKKYYIDELADFIANDYNAQAALNNF